LFRDCESRECDAATTLFEAAVEVDGEIDAMKRTATGWSGNLEHASLAQSESLFSPRISIRNFLAYVQLYRTVTRYKYAPVRARERAECIFSCKLIKPAVRNNNKLVSRAGRARPFRINYARITGNATIAGKSISCSESLLRSCDTFWRRHPEFSTFPPPLTPRASSANAFA